MNADLAWAGGLLDGEACIAIARCKQPNGSIIYHPVIQVDMANEPTLWRLRTIFGCGPIWSQRPRKKARNPKPMFRWRPFGSDAAYIVRQIEPYLYTKRAEAVCVLAFLEAPREMHEWFYWECRRLKQEPEEMDAA